MGRVMDSYFLALTAIVTDGGERIWKNQICLFICKVKCLIHVVKAGAFMSCSNAHEFLLVYTKVGGRAGTIHVCFDFALFTTIPAEWEWVGRVILKISEGNFLHMAYQGTTRFHAIYNKAVRFGLILGLGWKGNFFLFV
ncbi:uncharacterized protein LOC126596210 [Malus sylvestris]|uniref:uncharacterized protein LOC126596210 n=1 Tax=Malus sylvestris TaxID=3752 RepID=UPI0021AC2F95|nr:uncharacterized protein LOC126596210 [Malus sylvestris]